MRGAPSNGNPCLVIAQKIGGSIRHINQRSRRQRHHARHNSGPVLTGHRQLENLLLRQVRDIQSVRSKDRAGITSPRLTLSKSLSRTKVIGKTHTRIKTIHVIFLNPRQGGWGWLCVGVPSRWCIVHLREKYRHASAAAPPAVTGRARPLRGARARRVVSRRHGDTEGDILSPFSPVKLA